MANYCCTVRTNYFHVKNEQEFLNMMNKVHGCEDTVEVATDKDKDGNTVFCILCYGCISGFKDKNKDEDDEDEWDSEPDYDEFISRLQKCVAEDDAIIIMESGHEKLRYVVGQATIITSTTCETFDVKEIATKRAAELLNNPKWTTKCEY